MSGPLFDLLASLLFLACTVALLAYLAKRLREDQYASDDGLLVCAIWAGLVAVVAVMLSAYCVDTYAHTLGGWPK